MSKKQPTCPICGEDVEHRYRPFCSKRCADVDLGRWLTGRYAIAGHADAEEDDLPDSDTIASARTNDNEPPENDRD